MAIAHAIAAVGRAAGGTVAIQVSMYLGTALLANVVSNNAAAALMYPIAITIAEDEDLDKPRTAYLLMLAASASFAVPFAYQTNLMVYGAGGYTFQDFLRFGGPLQVRIRCRWYPAVSGSLAHPIPNNSHFPGMIFATLIQKVRTSAQHHYSVALLLLEVLPCAERACLLLCAVCCR